jgi:hypothetical protein
VPLLLVVSLDTLFGLIVDQRGDLLSLFVCHFHVVYLLGVGRGLGQDFFIGLGVDNRIAIEANITAA